MVFFIIVMPILSVLFGEWRLKRATSNMLENTIEDLKTKAIAAINDPKFPVLLQSIGSQLAQGMVQTGGKEIKNVMPKFKLNDILGVLVMKYLGGGGLGNLGSLLGGGEQQQEGLNTSTPKGKLE